MECITSTYWDRRDLIGSRHVHKINLLITNIMYFNSPNLVTTRSKTLCCYCSIAGISNPADDMDGYLLYKLCVFRKNSLRRADPSSRGVLPSVYMIRYINKPLHLRWSGRRFETKNILNLPFASRFRDNRWGGHGDLRAKVEGLLLDWNCIFQI